MEKEEASPTGFLWLVVFALLFLFLITTGWLPETVSYWLHWRPASMAHY